MARALLIVLMTVGVLGFGAVGLCGGFVTATMLPDVLTWRGAGTPVLVLSLPCLIGGFFMVRICVRELMRLIRRPAAEDDLS